MKHRHASLLIVMGFAMCPLSNGYGQTAAKQQPPAPVADKIDTQALHVTNADGTTTIGELIRRQNHGSPLPTDLRIKTITFHVDPLHDPLIFPAVEGFQDPAFQWAVNPGASKTLRVTFVAALTPMQAFDLYPVRTDGVANFLMVTDFWPAGTTAP